MKRGLALLPMVISGGLLACQRTQLAADVAGRPAPGTDAAAVDPCLAKLSDLVKLQTGDDVEVSAVVELDGLRKVIVKDTATGALKELFVSRDCIHGTDRLFELDSYRTLLIDDKAFASCLSSRGLVIYGAVDDSRTTQQLNTAGLFASTVFVDCEGDNLEKCKNAGVTQLPTIGYQNRLYPAPMDRNALHQLTGCGSAEGPAASSGPSPAPAVPMTAGPIAPPSATAVPPPYPTAEEPPPRAPAPPPPAPGQTQVPINPDNKVCGGPPPPPPPPSATH